ncbi:MAG: porin family protein, partial [Pseudolabrys sp.]|nr:porin family protein [Pseudolabrys sp.]
MRGVRLLLAVLAALAAGPATAADMPVKARVYQAPAAVAPSWSGFYGGLSLGARFADNNWRSGEVLPLFGAGAVQPGATSGSMNSVAARIGAYAGYNWQFAPAWIAGIEADIGWADNKKSANPAPGTNVLVYGVLPPILPIGTVKQDWDGSVRGRLGTLIYPDTLLFATGGLAIQRVKLSASCAVSNPAVDFCFTPQNESYTKTMTGWTVGGGVEQKLWGNWLARLDYRYAD